MPALIDTGASRTVVTAEAVEKAGLRQVDEVDISRAGGRETKAPVYVACMQFPLWKLAMIETLEVVKLELPDQPVHCLIGRDILARWQFTYDGRSGSWSIEEDLVAAWISPPSD